MVLEVTDSNFEELRKSKKFMVLDFWAEWCGPCRMIGPVIDQLAERYECVVTFGKLDVDTNNDVVALFGVRSIPTILFFKDGEVVDKVVGAAQRATFIEKIDTLIVEE
ncbi:MAG: thioredoxin [Tannerellaceae bacterium]|jgi:thioredoxin 1|nr:thioredoxin [Tannerellaceae bacterium]